MRAWVVFALAVVPLAGCLDATGTGLDGAQPVAQHAVAGRLLTPAFNPIAGATVTITNPEAVLDDGTVTPETIERTTVSDAEGGFALLSFPGNHQLAVQHPDYEPYALNVSVPGDNLTLILTPIARIVPFQHTVPFDGYIECALEALIITPSCDSAVSYGNEEYGTPDPGLFENDSVFEVEVEDDWKAIVLDVSFDGSSHPGMAGMRASSYAADASAEVFDYQRINQEWGEGPFTLRVEPAVDYGGDALAPAGAGLIRFEFFPHGHGDDSVCSPQDGTCFLGAATTQGLQFEAIATIFYHETAPEGWSLHSA